MGNSILESEKKVVEKLNKQDNRRTRWKAETLNNVKQDKKETMNARKLEANEEKTESPSESVQVQKDPKPEKCQDLSRQKNPTDEKLQNLRLIKREPRVGKHESLEEKPFRLSKDQQSDEEQKVQNAHETPRAPAIQEETSQKPQRAAWERKSISRLEVKINSRVRNSTEAASPPPASIRQVIRS